MLSQSSQLRWKRICPFTRDFLDGLTLTTVASDVHDSTGVRLFGKPIPGAPTGISQLDSCRRTPSAILRSIMPRTRPVDSFLTPDRLLGPRRELLGAFCRRRGLLVPVRQSLSAAPAITVNAKASSRSRYGSNPPSLLIVAPWNSSRIEPSKPSLNASLRDSPIGWAFHVRGKVTETPCITASNVCRFYHTRKVIREIQVRALPARLLLSHADRCRDHLATRQRLPPVAAGLP